jgi:hypothetical protein
MAWSIKQMEKNIAWAFQQPIVIETSDIVPAGVTAHVYPDTACAFAVLDGAFSVADRVRRFWTLKGPGKRVWASSIKVNEPSKPVTLLSRILNLFRS